MYRAIVVDDEPFMLEGMRLMIDWQSCGFELVGEAGDAQQALHLIDEKKPDLLITDVLMPGLLGTDLAELVARHYPDILLLFFSGYKDFSYAQAAIRAHALCYLVKPIDQDEVQALLLDAKSRLDERTALRAQSDKATPQQREHTLRRIASGDMGESTLGRAAVLLGLTNHDASYCAMCRLPKADEQTRALAREKAAQTGGMAFFLSDTRLGLMYKGYRGDLGTLTQLRMELSALFSAPIDIGVGGDGLGAEGFAISLEQALDALDLLFLPLDGLQIYQPFDGQTEGWLLGQPIAPMMAALEQGRGDELAARLQALRDRVRREQPSPFALRVMAKQMEPTLVRLAFHRGVSPLPEQPLRELWARQSLPITPWLDALEKALLGYLPDAPEKEAQARPQIVEKALEYLLEHYQKELSVGDVAAALFVNAAYLGQMVRKHTGQTMLGHLAAIRMDKACLMLRQSTDSVSQIAASVGIPDVDYFSSQFRRHTGMSPRAYRQIERPDRREALA